MTITGGDSVNRAGDSGFRVPKRGLATAVALALEQWRMKVPADLSHADTMRAEMATSGSRSTWPAMTPTAPARRGEHHSGSGYTDFDPLYGYRR